MLDNNQTSVRLAARTLIHGLWETVAAVPPQQAVLLRVLTELLPEAAQYGRQSAELMELVSFFVRKRSPADSALPAGLTTSVIAAVQAHASALAAPERTHVQHAGQSAGA